VEIRRTLPDGRVLVVAPGGLGVPLADGSVGAWRCFLEGGDSKPALGAPLVFVLMCLLGEEVAAAPPAWIANLAAELELETRLN